METENERTNLANIKRNLQRQVREVEEDLDIQRQELSTGFDEVLRRRENEFRNQLDDLSATALAHEMKVCTVKKQFSGNFINNKLITNRICPFESALINT